MQFHLCVQASRRHAGAERGRKEKDHPETRPLETAVCINCIARTVRQALSSKRALLFVSLRLGRDGTNEMSEEGKQTEVTRGVAMR